MYNYVNFYSESRMKHNLCHLQKKMCTSGQFILVEGLKASLIIMLNCLTIACIIVINVCQAYLHVRRYTKHIYAHICNTCICTYVCTYMCACVICTYELYVYRYKYAHVCIYCTVLVYYDI